MAMNVLANWLWHRSSMVTGLALVPTLTCILRARSCICNVQPLLRIQQSRMTSTGLLLLSLGGSVS